MAEDGFLKLKKIFSRNFSTDQQADHKDTPPPSKLIASENSILIKLKVKDKYQYIKNKMICIIFLMAFPLAFIIAAVVDDSWILSKSEHFSLLYVYDDEDGTTYSYSQFISDECSDPHLIPDAKSDCDFYDYLKIIGIILFCFYIIAMILNIISGVILALIVRWPDAFVAIKSKTGWKMKLFSIFASILYFLCTLIYLVGGLAVKDRDFNFGRDFYLALAGCLIYFFVFLYYWRVKRKMKKNQMISKLLNPDNLLLKSDFGVIINNSSN